MTEAKTLDAVLALHPAIPRYRDYTKKCERQGHRGFRADSPPRFEVCLTCPPRGRYCGTCVDVEFNYQVWPCETVLAVRKRDE